MPILEVSPFQVAAFTFSQRTAKLASCTQAGYGASRATVMSTATTNKPLEARARSIGSSAKRSFLFQAPPCRSRTVGKFRLVNPGHQHPAGAVAPKLDFADGKVKPRGGIICGRAGCVDGAGPERAHSGQTCRAHGGHQLENVTPNESAFVQVLLPQNDWLPQ